MSDEDNYLISITLIFKIVRIDSMEGTLVNTGAIIAGSLLGIMIHSRLSPKIVNITFQGLGLVTLAIGISMSLHAENMTLIVASIVLGAITGQVIDIERYMHRFTSFLHKKGKKFKAEVQERGNSTDKFAEGLITASMLFCIGSMSILGAIEDGMGSTPSLLYTKAVMDGVASIALASSFGICILFSSLSVLIYQGSITFFAAFIMRYMSDSMTENMTAVGGILLIGLAVNILKIKEINITNMLPALVFIIILSYFF